MTFGYDLKTIKRSSDTNLIVSKFLLASSEDRSVQLINIYKGVPISHNASVIKVINDRLTLKFHKNHTLCLNMEGRTYIQSKLFLKPIKARVMTINTTEGYAILTDLILSDPSFRKRQHLRIALDYDESTVVSICAPDCNVKLFGKLKDISTHGVGVIVIAVEDIISKSFSQASQVQIQFYLPFTHPEEATEIKVPGEIRYIDRDQENFKLGIQTFPDPDTETRIEKFITQRKTEILEEVEKYSTTLSLGEWWFPS